MDLTLLKNVSYKWRDVRAAKILWVVIWVPWIIIFVIYSIGLIRYPYEWEPGEGSKILYAQRLLDGKPIYSSNQQFPMLGNCYPPLYPLVTAGIVALTGPNLFAGRAVSFVAIIILLCLLYRVARMLTGSRSWAIVGTACFVFPAPLASWYSLARMDSLCSLLLFVMAYIIFRKPKSTTASFLAGLCAVCALYTKQTALFVVIMMFIYYIVNKRWKQSFIYLTTVLVISGCLFFICQLLSDGWFARNLFSDNVHRQFFAQRYTLFFGWIFSWNIWVCLLACATVLWRVYLKKWDIWIFYFLGGLINALLIGANGSGFNYFFSLWSATALFFAEGLAYIETFIYKTWADRQKTGKFVLLAGILCLTTITFAHGKPVFFYRDTLLNYIPSRSDKRILRSIEEYIKRSQGTIFVDRLPSITLRYNKTHFYMEPALIQELYHAGKWNPEPMIQMVAEKKFQIILLLSESLVPYPVKQAIDRYYLISEKIPIPTFEIWRPRYMLVYRPAQ